MFRGESLIPRHQEALPTKERESDIEVAYLGDPEKGFCFVGSPTGFSEPLTTEDLVVKIAQTEARIRGIDPEKPLIDQLTGDEIATLIKQGDTIFPELVTFELGQYIPDKHWSMMEWVQAHIPLNNGSGVVARNWTPESYSQEEVTRRAVETGVKLLAAGMKGKGYSDIDAVIVSSAFLPLNMADSIIELAIQKGVLPKKRTGEPRHTSEVRLFCSGSAVAVAHALTHEKIKKCKRVAILALEPLEELLGAVHGQHRLTLDNAKLSLIFGNNSGALLVDPTQYRLHPSSHIAFEHVREIMGVHSMFDAPSQPGLPTNLYPFFEGDLNELRFDEFDNHCLIGMQKYDMNGRAAVMNATEVARYFGEKTPQVIKNIINHLGLTTSQILIFNHVPSLSVLKRVARRLKNVVTLKFHHSPKPEESDLPGIEFMPGSSTGANSSSATIFDQMWNYAKARSGDAPSFMGGTNPEQKAVVLVGMGIGATIGAIVVVPRDNAE